MAERDEFVDWAISELRSAEPGDLEKSIGKECPGTDDSTCSERSEPERRLEDIPLGRLIVPGFLGEIIPRR